MPFFSEFTLIILKITWNVFCGNSSKISINSRLPHLKAVLISPPFNPFWSDISLKLKFLPIKNPRTEEFALCAGDANIFRGRGSEFSSLSSERTSKPWFLLGFSHGIPFFFKIKGSSYQSHFIFEINVVNSRIRHRTTLKLNF